MRLRFPHIAFGLLVGFIAIDLAMSSWQFSAVSPMSAFPALMFAAISAVKREQPAGARVLSAVVALAAAGIVVALKLNSP